jgi:CubicO group peptidase (beta-lactamase class C family)
MLYAPGEKYYYSNTAYYLLGLIIEKVSGKSYEEFIDDYIFKPLGMKNSYYGSKSKIILNRASGYDNANNKVDENFNANDNFNAGTIASIQIFSAGSLMSTVNDIFLWNRAIRNNKLISKENKKKAFTNYQLKNGSYANYGYGWANSTVKGAVTIEHNGAIPGFSSNSIYLPKEDVFIVLLSNCICDPTDYISTKMAAISINKPYKDLDKNNMDIDPKFIQKFVGTYEFDDGSIRVISQENNELYSQKPNRTKSKIYLGENNRFYFKNSFSNLIFDLNADKQPSIIYENRIFKSKGVKVK